MNETTALLVDHVIADVPLRHWALTFPPPLCYLLAYDAALCSKVLNIFVHTIFDWQRRLAKRELGLARLSDAVPAAVTAIHRVGSAINLNLHLHSAFADGVFVRAGSATPPTFRALPAPTRGDELALAWDICERTTKLLQRIGRYFDADPADADELMSSQPLLAACYQASLQGTVAVGDRAGRRLLRLGQPTSADNHQDRGPTGPGHGFNLHAGMRTSAPDRRGRERLLRYILRPPIATKRLELTADGRVVYWLRQPWADGTRSFIFEPLDFVTKLIPLIPPPRANQIRYHGAWAPHAAIRAEVVPQPPPGSRLPAQLGFPFSARRRPGARRTGHAPDRGQGARRAAGEHCQRGEEYQVGVASQVSRPGSPPVVRHRLSWRELAKRTFAVDVLECPRCGRSPMVVLGQVQSATSSHVAVSLGLVFDSEKSGRVSGRTFRARGPPSALGQLSFGFASGAC